MNFTFFSLLTTAFSCIVYGVIVTTVIMAILYGILKCISKSITQIPIFYITGFVLAVLLIIQTTLLIGAIQAKDAADSAEVYLRQLLENDHRTVGANDSQHIFEAVKERYPIIGSFWGLADYTGYETSELPETMHEVMIEYLNSYIWHRVLWILGFIIVASFLVMLFDKPNQDKSKRNALSSRHDDYRAHSRRHQRVGRRR